MSLDTKLQKHKSNNNNIVTKIPNSLANSTKFIQPFFGIAASLVYILAMEWYPLTSPDLKRLPVHQKSKKYNKI